MNTNKPINQDSSFNAMDNGAAVTAWNTMLTADKKARCNEPGFRPIFTSIDTEYQTTIIGVVEIPSGCIAFYVDSTNTYSYIIWYEERVDVSGISKKTVITHRNTQLGFNSERPIKGEYTYNYNKELIVVFIEGVMENANKPRYLNVTKAKSVGFDINDIDLTIPVDCIDFYFNDSGSGRLPIGTYVFKIRYVDEEGLETNGLNLSKIVPVVKMGSSVETVQGGKPGAWSNQSISLTFVDLTTKCNRCKIYIIHNNGTTDSYYCTDTLSYNGTILNYTISSLDGLNNSSYEAVFKNSIAINKASAITKMNNSLLLGNIEVINLGTVVDSNHHNLTKVSNGTGKTGKATIAALGQAIANDAVINYSIGFTNPSYNPSIAGGHHKTFLPDEVYALYLTLRLKTGGVLGTWHIPGRPAATYDLDSVWNANINASKPRYRIEDTSSAGKVYSAAPNGLIVPSGNGAMGYWENLNETYPSTFPSAHTGVQVGEHSSIRHVKSDQNVVLANQKVRHHRTPSSRHWSNNIEISIGVSNVIIPDELKPYVSGIEIHYAKRTMSNSLQVCQGLYSSISKYSRRFHSFDALYHKMDLSNIAQIKQLKDYTNVVVNNINYSKLGAVEYFPGNDFSDPDYGDWTDLTASWETNRDSIFINELLEIPNQNDYLPFTKSPKNLKFREHNDSANNRFQESHYTLIFRDGTTGLSDYTSGAGNDGTPRLVALFNELDDCYPNWLNQELCLAGIYNYPPDEGTYLANPELYFSQGDCVLTHYYYRINYAHSQHTQDDGEFTDNAYVNPNVGRTGHIWYCTYLMHVAHYSTCNAQLRHEGINPNETFYPVCSTETWFKMGALADNWINTATGKAYNQVYSKLNDYEQPLIVDFSAKYSDKLPYRICVSNPNRTESLQFNWRNFDTEYFDVNYDKGQIMCLFATPNKLYIQQEYGLFVTTLNDTIKTDSGSGLEIRASSLLGRTPIEIIDDNIGAIGCVHRFSNKLTKAGYVAIDVKKHKIFVVRDTVIPISDFGLKQFYIDNLKYQGDNPFINNGIYVIDDIIENDRIVICDNNTGGGFTISYDTRLWQPISFHNYQPAMIARTRAGLLAFANNDSYRLYIMNKGSYGKYIVTPDTQDVTHPMWLDLQLNPQFQIEKLLRSVNWITSVITPSGVLDYTKTFNLILVYNDTQCTGYKPIIPQDCWYNHEFGKLAQGNWFYNNISDLIADDSLPIGISLSDWQLNSDNLLESPEFFVNSDIIGNYCIVRFLYDNTDNCKLQFEDFNANLYKVTR